jgi:hypothetical protein
MPGRDATARSITAFHLGEEYVFDHYFEREHVFERVREHYDDDGYRFEVPADDWPDVRESLETAGYTVAVVEDPEPFCVVVEKYEPHADVLRESVAHWERRDHLFFLLRDERAVDVALDAGATPVAETEFALGI